MPKDKKAVEPQNYEVLKKECEEIAKAEYIEEQCQKIREKFVID